MADMKISQMPQKTSLDATDIFPIISGNVNKTISAGTIIQAAQTNSQNQRLKVSVAPAYYEDATIDLQKTFHVGVPSTTPIALTLGSTAEGDVKIISNIGATASVFLTPSNGGFGFSSVEIQPNGTLTLIAVANKWQIISSQLATIS